MRYIVALFSQHGSTTATARRLNAELVKAGSKVTFDVVNGGVNLPHVTLTHVVLDSEGSAQLLLQLILDALERRKINHEPVLIPAALMLTITPRFDKWIFWDAHPNEDFYTLLEIVLEEANLLRRGRRVEVSWSMNLAQQAAWERHGYPNTGEALEPHITLGLVDAANIQAALAAVPPVLNEHTVFDRIVIAPAGEHGTVNTNDIISIRRL